MKQTILHMMEYDCNKRIPIFSLHNNLQEITHIYQSEQEFSVGLNNYDEIFSLDSRHRWFAEDVKKGDFKYTKIKQ